MKRLLLLTMISLLAASSGCQSTGGRSGSGGGLFSRCRLFNSNSRGDACNACVVASPSCGCPCETSGPVYSQSVPVYNGFAGGGYDSGCCGGGSGGYNGGVVYGDAGGYGGCASGNCGGGFPGMQYDAGQQFQPGTVIPGQGMIIDGGSQQIPYLPAPQQGQQSPQTVPTPGPATGT